MPFQLRIHKAFGVTSAIVHMISRYKIWSFNIILQYPWTQGLNPERAKCLNPEMRLSKYSLTFLAILTHFSQGTHLISWIATTYHYMKIYWILFWLMDWAMTEFFSIQLMKSTLTKVFFPMSSKWKAVSITSVCTPSRTSLAHLFWIVGGNGSTTKSLQIRGVKHKAQEPELAFPELLWSHNSAVFMIRSFLWSP